MLWVDVAGVYLLVMAIASVYWAVQIRTLNGSNYAHTILLLCFAVCFYILGYAMELNSDSMPQIVFWNHVEYLGIPFVSALWLTVGLMYTGHFTRYTKLLSAAIYGIPFVTMFARFTNSFYHLYFASVGFVNQYGRLFLVKKPGPWMYVQMIHSMLMIFITFGLFIWDSFKSEKKETGKICLLIGASIFAVSGLLLSLIKPFGFTIDYMALCLPVTCVIIILSIAQYDFLETKSIARSKVFETSRNAILLINRRNRIIDYNHSAACFFEKVNIKIADRHLSSLCGQAPDLLEKLQRTETSVVKLGVGTEESYYEVSTKGIVYHGILHGWIKTIHDITETYKLNEDLKRQAMMDELSGLNNRRAFMQTGQEWMIKSGENGRPVHLLMMDLDHFKDVNDRYGHPMGDQVIHNFGTILKKYFRTDSLVARLGGEEFAVLLPGFSDPEIEKKVHTFREKAAAYTYVFQGREFHVTVSIGVAKKNHSAQTLDSLMRMADKALYQSKDHGRNCVTMV